MTTQKILVALIGIVLCTGVDCKKDIVDPPTDDIKPGRRDYVWTVDTLDMKPTDTFSLMRMWGSSPTDIWLTGEAGNTTNALWHYDGVRWDRYINQKNIYPTALFGFSKSDVWLASSYNSIWHYDGIDWKEVHIFTLTGDSIFIVNNLYGMSPNNIFAIGGLGRIGINGARTAIAHFDGNKWCFLAAPNVQGVFGSIFYQESSNRYFIDGTNYNSQTGFFTDFIYSYGDRSFKKICEDSINGASIRGIRNEVYLLSGKRIYKIYNSDLNLWKNFSNTEYVGSLFGRSEKDFFGESKSGILHHNGIDFVEILQTPFLIESNAIFDKDIFIGMINYNTGYKSVFHGKLNDD